MVFVAVLIVLPLVLSTYWINLLTLALVYSLAVYSLTLLTGFTGLTGLARIRRRRRSNAVHAIVASEV